MAPITQLIHATMFTFSRNAKKYPLIEQMTANAIASKMKGVIFFVSKLANPAGITSILITMIAPTDSKLKTVLKEVNPKSK